MCVYVCVCERETEREREKERERRRGRSRRLWDGSRKDEREGEIKIRGIRRKEVAKCNNTQITFSFAVSLAVKNQQRWPQPHTVGS